MNTKCINCLNMFQTTQACLEANESVYKNVPAVVTTSGELDDLVTAILTAQRAQASAEGLAAAKTSVREDLAEAAYEIASLVHACAQQHGVEEVASRTDLSRTDVQSGKEAKFIDRIKGILDDAALLVDDLGDCGVTPAKLKALKDLVAKFEKVKPLPRNGVSDGSSATRRLSVLFARTSKLLRTRLDRLVVQFKKTNPEFYEAYQTARKIVKLAATHDASKVNVAGGSVSGQPKAA
jgi:hypothetical protein